MKKVQVLIAIFAVSLTSCTVTKRVHNNGYYVEWNQNKFKATDKQNTKIETLETIEDSKIVVQHVPTSSVPVTLTTSTPIIAKSDNATNEVKASKPVSKSNISINKVAKSENKKTITTQKKKVVKEKQATGSSGKSQIVALILCILLGLIGIHRFYLGYTGLGVLYLFTLGLFGIGWLIDLILLIIPNGLAPKGKTNYRE